MVNNVFYAKSYIQCNRLQKIIIMANMFIFLRSYHFTQNFNKYIDYHICKKISWQEDYIFKFGIGVDKSYLTLTMVMII